MFVDGNTSSYIKVIHALQPVVSADVLGDPTSSWDYRIELSTALRARHTIKPFKQFLKGLSIRWLFCVLRVANVSQFNKEAVDIKFDAVDGFLSINQILHRKTINYEVRQCKYISGTSRIGMRISEGDGRIVLQKLSTQCGILEFSSP